MEKIPLFEEFTEFLTNIYKGAMKGFRDKRWGFLVVYIIVVITLLCTFLAGVIIAIDSGISHYKNLFPQKIENTTPQKTLIYKREDAMKDKDNLYHTSFTVSVQTPAGNPIQTDTVIRNFENAECTFNSIGGITEFSAGIASTTKYYLFSCITKEPIIDTGDLFLLKQ